MTAPYPTEEEIAREIDQVINDFVGRRFDLYFDRKVVDAAIRYWAKSRLPSLFPPAGREVEAIEACAQVVADKAEELRALGNGTACTIALILDEQVSAIRAIKGGRQ